MINLFSKYKLLFYLINLAFIILYLFPGNFYKCIILQNCFIEQITTNDMAWLDTDLAWLDKTYNKSLFEEIISMDHLYGFFTVSVIGYLSFSKKKHRRYLIIYLILLSIILEIIHFIIPNRSFEWPDLIGNLLAVIIVIFIFNLINKYGVFKK